VRRAAASLVALSLALSLARARAEAGPPWPDPTPPVDYDDDPDDGKSELWERVLSPDGSRYADAVARAIPQLSSAVAAQRLAGETGLRQAIALAPERALARVWLARALAARGDHAGCAAELAAARAREPGFKPDAATAGTWPAAWSLELELGLCQARGGALEAAVVTFAGLVERGVEEPVVLERLGDASMALGRLDDARAAFERARRAAPQAAGPEFALAVVDDRDGRRAASRAHLEIALARDPNLATLAPPRPYAPLDDEHYYLALALEQLGDRPRALYHMRRYLAGDDATHDGVPREGRGGPWTARARGHLEQLAAGRIGEPLALKGSAKLDPTAEARAKKVLAAADPQFQACVAKLPDLLLAVTVTRVVQGGKPPATAATATAAPASSPGVRAVVLEQHGVDPEALRRAIECTEQIAERLALPRPQGERGAFSTIEFGVIAR
jgi:tetratricopeptide (TPR) repeat protein